MKFHKEGIPTLLVAIIFSAILIITSRLLLSPYPIAHYFSYLLSAGAIMAFSSSVCSRVG